MPAMITCSVIYYLTLIPHVTVLSFAWLSALPFARNQFNLSAQEFRDGLALHYKKPFTQTHVFCDGCV